MKKVYLDEMKVAYMVNITMMIVESFLIRAKHYDLKELNYDHIVKEAKETGFILTNEEVALIKSTSKWYLKTYRNIEIINDNPIKIRETRKYQKKPNLHENKPQTPLQ